jgi:acyl-[acyl-carrier-protein]-phospholipid O-acyltransferase/long-chain-fatty-acid--[acyl-carrier-protein] ligase
MELAGLGVVVTSRAFLDRVKIDPGVFEGVRIVYLEDVKASIGAGDKLRAVLRAVFPGGLARVSEGEHRGPAAILFTSGSEGLPKGVLLSHENIIANIWQALSRVDVGRGTISSTPCPYFTVSVSRSGSSCR